MPAPLSPLGTLARRHDPDRFLCALFAPPARREALFTLIAFNHELARAREVASGPMPTLIRLQWWHDVVEEAAAGAPPRLHEVAGPLASLIRAGTLSAPDLLTMAEAREAEADDAISDLPAFTAYLHGTAGALGVATGRLLGVADDPVLDALRTANAAYGLAGVLRSVALLARAGRCLLPLDRLAALGLTREAAIADPAAPPVATLIAALATEGRAMLSGSHPPMRHSIAAALPLVLAARDLRRLERAAPPIVPRPRALGDRLAVLVAGIRGRV